MKIVLSADWFYPAQVGGCANTIYWHAKSLMQQGHQVRVIATARGIPASVPRNCWLELDCGRVMYVETPFFYLPFRHIWYGWKALRTADVVHVNSLFYPASVLWVLGCRLHRKPVVWSPHGELSEAALRFRPVLKRLLLLLFRTISSDVLFHATSVQEIKQIQRYFGERVWITRIRTMMELPLPVERVPRPYLLFMGRLHPIKAIERLLQALQLSRTFQASPYVLQIAGPSVNSDYTQQLKNNVVAMGLSAKVFFVDVVQGEHKEQVYANARALILPSYAENFGNVVIEALAQGTPVIASTNTPWQVLEIKRVGRWVPNDAESLRDAIDMFLTMTPDRYEGYRVRARQLARQDYTISRHLSLWSEVYETVQARYALYR